MVIITLVFGLLPPIENFSKSYELLIANYDLKFFSPFIGMKIVSRISVEQLWNVTHPRYSISLGKEPQLLGEAFELLAVRDLMADNAIMSMMLKSTAIILC